MTAATTETDNQPVAMKEGGEETVVEQQEADAEQVNSEAPPPAAADSNNNNKMVVTPPSKTATQDHVYSPELLKLYYARLFPYSLLGSWLSYSTTENTADKDKPNNNNNKVFSRREFSFTLEPLPGEEIYIRYQSFQNKEELAKAIQRRQPHKIDIGAVFSQAPKDKQAYISSSKDSHTFHPVQRELVFDIDLTDYDDIRKCGCHGAKICNTCWTYMSMALEIMDCGLREDFGFEHIAWFYSGRRGVHAWVCDEEARFLTNEARSAVANYFEISMSKKSKSEGLLSSSNNNTTTIHPMLKRAYDILEPYFCQYVLPEDGHGLLASPEQWDNLLDSLPTATARDTVGANLKEKWAKLEGTEKELSPEEKWKQLLQHLRVKFDLQDDHEEENASDGNSTSNKRPKLSTSMHETDKGKQRIAVWPMEVVFEQTYPRLDINVSKMQNHLLKSPFCVHPKTGRVCVPINVKNINDFDPFAVPTLAQLVQELDEYHQQHSGDDDSQQKLEFEWQKTSLKPYFEGFQTDFLVPMQKEWRRQERDQADQEAAIRGDF